LRGICTIKYVIIHSSNVGEINYQHLVTRELSRLVGWLKCPEFVNETALQPEAIMYILWQQLLNRIWCISSISYIVKALENKKGYHIKKNDIETNSKSKNLQNSKLQKIS